MYSPLTHADYLVVGETLGPIAAVPALLRIGPLPQAKRASNARVGFGAGLPARGSRRVV